MNGNGKNIVLDIDATLVHTHGDMDDFKMLNVYGNDEQLEMVFHVINPEHWALRFKRSKSDVELAKQVAKESSL